MKVNQYIGASPARFCVQTLCNEIRSLATENKVNHRVALFGPFEDAIREYKNKGGNIARLARFFREKVSTCQHLDSKTVQVYLYQFINIDMIRK